MLKVRAMNEQHAADDASIDHLYSDEFLVERPLLQAIRAGDRCVLLIDEVDRADDEFEAFLLELLSDFQITIPERGTIRAESKPIVILTSNRTRELHDALKRRCLYHWIGFPSPEREVDIVTTRVPGVRETMAERVVAAVNRLRDMDLAKPPGVAETLDWVTALDAVGADTLDQQHAADTLGAVVKDRDDLELVAGSLGRVVGDV
jgi:MoxR-like ATPase